MVCPKCKMYQAAYKEGLDLMNWLAVNHPKMWKHIIDTYPGQGNWK